LLPINWCAAGEIACSLQNRIAFDLDSAFFLNSHSWHNALIVQGKYSGLCCAIIKYDPKRPKIACIDVVPALLAGPASTGGRH